MIEELMRYGLSEKEAQTYVSCLKIGKATANRIAELMDLPRSTTYDILERLKSLGLVTTIIESNKTHFIASDPDVLLTSLDEKKNDIVNILPNLKEIHNKVGERPMAEVFQGKIAVFKLLDEIVLNARSEIKILGSQENAIEKLGYRPDRFKAIRISKKIRSKQILEYSKESLKEKKDKTTEVRYMQSLNRSKEAIFILEEYVYHIMIQHELSAIRIKSKDHAETMNIMFDELWDKSKK